MFIYRLRNAALLCLMFVSNSALGSGFKDFDQKEFEAAQKEGRSIVLDFYADWCPTCKRQAPVLEGLLKEEKYKGFVAFKVDYDKADDLKKALKIPRQSTIIVFKGSEEKGRNVAGTAKDDLDKLFAKGL